MSDDELLSEEDVERLKVLRRLTRKRAQAKVRSSLRKEAGVCQYCGKSLVSDGYATCDVCRSQINPKARENMSRVIKSGLCRTCKTKLASPDSAHCQVCALRIEERRNARHDAGKCRFSKCQAERLATSPFCEHHKHTRGPGGGAALRDERLRLGKCIQCGEPSVTKRHCEVHRAMSVEASRRWQARKRA